VNFFSEGLISQHFSVTAMPAATDLDRDDTGLDCPDNAFYRPHHAARRFLEPDWSSLRLIGNH
jgi:hypothetical protein